jgi:carnitine O-acetyltransferase
MLNFKEMLDKGTFPPEYIRDRPLCMNQYTEMFGMTRIPGEKADTLKIDKTSNAKHIIVMTKDQMYKLDVVHSDGRRATIADLERYTKLTQRDA